MTYPGEHSPLDHVWYWRSRLPERKGEHCRVLVRGGSMNTVLVEFADGTRVTTSRYAVRKVRVSPVTILQTPQQHPQPAQRA